MGLNEKFFNSATDEDEGFFNTVLYPGTGIAKAITGVGFAPDLVWIKKRNSPTFSYHMLFDTVRGVDNLIRTNLSTEEYQGGGTGYQTSFDPLGFSITGNTFVNNSSNTFVAWCWKAGGAPVSNSDGDITSQVSANVADGFSIVSYTGNSSFGQTIGHGLGVQPQMVIHKNLSNARNWRTYVEPLGATKYINLDETAAEGTYGSFNNTAPTSTVFSTTNSIADRATNFNGDNYIAYCFHSVAGVSKVGSFVGTGASGKKIPLDFEPSWIMIKRTSSSGAGWYITDNKRSTASVKNDYLSANSDGAEATAGSGITFNTDGFTFSGASYNTSGATHIYYAIA